MNRSEILTAAEKCVNGNRQQDYGTPERSFETIAALWNAYLSGTGFSILAIKPDDVAAMLALLKIARIATGHGKDDNWIDLAGYAACGGEIQSLRCPPAVVGVMATQKKPETPSTLESAPDRNPSSADERIDALIKRAGCPVMAVKNTQESEEEKRAGAKNAIERILLEKYNGNVNDYITYLVDTIDRLENALHNVIGQREQLLRDLNRACLMSGYDTICTFCKNKEKDGTEYPCVSCATFEMESESKFEWRGVQPDD